MELFSATLTDLRVNDSRQQIEEAIFVHSSTIATCNIGTIQKKTQIFLELRAGKLSITSFTFIIGKISLISAVIFIFTVVKFVS